MSDGVTFVSIIVAFAPVIVVGAKLGAGATGSMTGLFASQGARDWPTGVQETDAPRYVFSAPRIVPIARSEHDPRPRPRFPADDGDGNTPVPELLELYSGPIRE